MQNPKTGGPNRLDVALGLQIRQRRRLLGVSQSALAGAVGITFQQIQKYERGSNRVSFSRLVDIAHALDCRAVDLIADLDDDAMPSLLFRQDTSHLRVGGAPELLSAFSAATPTLRRVILKLVEALARDQRTRHADSSEVDKETATA